MKLRRCSASHQLLFLLLCPLLAGSVAIAQDKITTRDGVTQDVKILAVNGPMIQVKIPAGTVSMQLNSIVRVVMAPPAEYTAAVAAFEAKDYAKALSGMSSVVARFKGLPTDWAQRATLMLGDIYVAQNDLPKAEAAYKEAQRIYPSQGSVQTDVGMARIAVSKKDYAGAKAKLETITDQALKQPNIPAADAAAYSQAFYLLGQVEEAAGNFPDALQDYLRTVTLFYQDRIAAADAQEKADALRKAHPGIVVP